MRALIVEDEVTSRRVLERMLEPYGECDSAGNGVEAIDAFTTALDAGNPYQLICMDIVMPEMNGQEALAKIREIEKQRGVRADEKARIIMTTVMRDATNIFDAFDKGIEAYIIKPVSRDDLMKQIEAFGLTGEEHPPEEEEPIQRQ
jgi:two-component system, chemotaxis family, chemotaxis protein CheY